MERARGGQRSSSAPTKERDEPGVTADPGGLVVRVDALGSLRRPGRVVVRSGVVDESGGSRSGLGRPSGARGGVGLDGDLGVELDIRARARAVIITAVVRRAAGNDCERSEEGQL
jgi:hypothetical protein